MDGGMVAAGRIGPNAITRLAEALGPDLARQVFAAAGLERRLAEPPGRMVPEGEVIALHRAARTIMGETAADAASREAGRLTALYLLAHRIPRPLQWILRVLPAPIAAQVLLGAIGRHAWTFAGSGAFRVRPGRPLRLEIAGAPIARAAAADHPVCGYYAATFETLFRALVSPRTRVQETACEAMGAEACVFEVRWQLPDDEAVEMPGRVAQDRQHHRQPHEERN
ncbi:bacteriochlorophyll 4-vinyl reductase [Falsiroseomonas oryzae]|uniref:bacteriochlorophyll 4-vinyl reductase n=1 Tax=Falsiroseomonas oryzae TaxID=2766473 RepID=UPI0022EA6B0B|nr:bacteriochlorophyll 4-vinyl reductase [Roseomonas sp. MO-31]